LSILNSKIFLYCDPSQSFIQKKRHIGIVCQFSAEIAIRFRNIFFTHWRMSLPQKGRLHEEAKDFRLWCSGGVYEPADADF